MTVCCFTEDKDAQLAGMICCHRHYGLCPIICCKYDAEIICWGFVCCKTIIDPCWIFRMIMHGLCICAPETKNSIFKWFFCNAKPVPEDSLSKKLTT